MRPQNSQAEENQPRNCDKMHVRLSFASTFISISHASSGIKPGMRSGHSTRFNAPSVSIPRCRTLRSPRFKPVQVHVSDFQRNSFPMHGMVMHQPKRRTRPLFLDIPRREDLTHQGGFPGTHDPVDRHHTAMRQCFAQGPGHFRQGCQSLHGPPLEFCQDRHVNFLWDPE